MNFSFKGIPLGLTGSLPYILSSRKVSYADQGTFSFAFWPFSLKLLWAPIVDSLFIEKIGRRKSWLVPIQYLLGIFMILFANYTRSLLEGTGHHEGL
jgi:PAT family acetyl-CoA transporter-like MFS transporter 1